MRRGSIRVRLLVAAAISILVALALAGVGLRTLFERHVERRVAAEIEVDLNQLIGSTIFAADGRLQALPQFSDPRFEIPLSGYYWQVRDLKTGDLQRSRSLWDMALPDVAGANDSGLAQLREAAGPDGAPLIMVERRITDREGRSFRAAVAENYRAVELSIAEYVGELAPALALLAGVLMLANFVQITVGLAPLEKLRVAIKDVIARRTARLDVKAPNEVQPLADEINRMLEVQQRALAHARTRAADLAHGLKTPLQVLSGDIRTLRKRGQTDLADEIEKSVASIRRHVDRELARARIAPGATEARRCNVARTAGNVIEVVRRTPAGQNLTFVSDMPDDLAAPVEEGDLAELLGNLIENAARYARTCVRVEASDSGTATTIRVADDGPGIADDLKDAALSRGVRLDRNGSGSGLGLAIVADLVEAYGGDLQMSDAEPQGLCVTICLPRQNATGRTRELAGTAD